eukprot:gnl/TRDRNA2_/TRDRNA2_37820_c1_seq1.p1 gnl/TRDRNA2_/TRDRNA2_37820_c1~~gnl/TRDRNA2_/TRDRNA2_37820_c1_seq1.p1  ORF type:complete len:465 (-),score=60.82 gnl/TRDRNA2_/TRDRNA2_37820_c1_seq1:174-1400(-)
MADAALEASVADALEDEASRVNAAAVFKQAAEIATRAAKEAEAASKWAMSKEATQQPTSMRSRPWTWIRPSGPRKVRPKVPDIEPEKMYWKKDVSRNIPKVVYIVGPFEPSAVVKHNELYGRNWSIRYYDYEQMELSVRNISQDLEHIGLSGAWEAYSALRPISFRTDLWRAMVLWKNGGVYIDAKVRLLKPVIAWIHDDRALSLCQQRDMPASTMMLAAPAGSTPLLRVIRKIIENVASRSYFKHKGHHADLFITGPGAYYEGLIGRFARKPNETQQQGSLPRAVEEGSSWPPDGVWIGCTQEVDAIWSGDQKLADYDENIHRRMKHCRQCNDYSWLYQHDQVYCEQEGVLCSFKTEGMDKPVVQMLTGHRSSAERSEAANPADRQNESAAKVSGWYLQDGHWSLDF